MRTRSILALALHGQGRSAEAEAMLREVLPLQEEVLGRKHPEMLEARSILALALHGQGRSAEAGHGAA